MVHLCLFPLTMFFWPIHFLTNGLRVILLSILCRFFFLLDYIYNLYIRPSSLVPSRLYLKKGYRSSNLLSKCLYILFCVKLYYYNDTNYVIQQIVKYSIIKFDNFSRKISLGLAFKIHKQIITTFFIHNFPQVLRFNCSCSFRIKSEFFVLIIKRLKIDKEFFFLKNIFKTYFHNLTYQYHFRLLYRSSRASDGQ